MPYNSRATRNDINISAIVVPCHSIRQLVARELVGKLYDLSYHKVTNSFKYHFNYDQVIENVQFNIQGRIKKNKKTPFNDNTPYHPFDTPPLRHIHIHVISN